MDKRIVDTLIKFGLITNVNVDPNKFESIDDLINKGIVTIPGAKSKIMELIGNIDNVTESPEITVESLKSDNNNIILDTPNDSSEVITDAPEQDNSNVIVDTIPDEKPLEDNTVENVEVIEENTEEVKTEEESVEENETTEEIIVDEVAEESTEEVKEEETPKKKKSKKTE